MCAKCRNSLARKHAATAKAARAPLAAEVPAAPFAEAVEAHDLAASASFPPVAATPAEPRTRRRRLWELPNGWQCSVIGTCLTLGDLRRTATRLGLYVGTAELTDYELHGYFVHDAKTDNRVGRLLQKMLDGAHEGTLRRFARCRDVEELARAWEAAVESGDVAGAYWAAMTHPAIDAELEGRLFGEVHMMSHLVGASARGDRRAVATLGQERDGLAAKLKRSEADRMQAIASRDGEIERLARALAEAERQARAAEAEAARLAALVDDADTARRTRRLDEAEARLATLERDAEEKARLLADGAAERQRLHEENRALLMELARAERALQAIAPEIEESDGDGRVDLAGRRILYVGGRKSTVSHARRLVERCNGCLLHHDGGLEQSVAELESTLMGADAVVFPVDCVSHNAINCVKRLCERRALPFRALRSSGLGSLVDALGELAA